MKNQYCSQKRLTDTESFRSYDIFIEANVYDLSFFVFQNVDESKSRIKIQK